jgi:hypothetical protein
MKIMSILALIVLLCTPWSVQALAPVSTGTEWQIQVLDDPQAFSAMTDRSLALDSDEHAHIAYGQDHLYYAHYSGTAWQVDVVDDSRALGKFASLALDDLNHAHIAYYDDGNGNLKYAHWTGIAWEIKLVDSAGDVGQDASLALDSLGYPHISYYDSTNSHLKYAYWTGAAWVIQTVDNADSGYCTSLAMDGADHAHIAYCAWESSNNSIKYAHWNGSAWELKTVKGTDSVGYSASIAVDSSEPYYPHITLYDCCYFLYYSWTGTAWNMAPIDWGSGSVGLDSSLVLDEAGNPHVSYYEDDGYTLRYASRSGSTWDVQTLTDAGYVKGYTSLQLKDGGEPVLSFYGAVGTHMGLRLATFDNPNWSIELVAKEGEAGETSSVALDSDDHPHISYDGGLDEDLIYTYWDGSVWYTQAVDSEGDTGESSSIALDSHNHPHISYVNDTTGEVKYASWDGAQWSFQTIYTSNPDSTYLALDSQDYPHIIFRDYVSYQYKLMYARWDGAAWQVETLNTVGTVNWSFSFVLDHNDRPHISYVDGDYSDELKYAYWTGSAWQIVPVGSSSNTNSIALDHNDLPCISFDNNAIMLTCWDGAKWNSQIVDNSDDVYEPSIMLDSSDYAHISYYDYSKHDLDYAVWNGSGWTIQVVDSLGDVGSENSLALDGQDMPHIVYYDETGHDLVYARGVPIMLKDTYLPLVRH